MNDQMSTTKGILWEERNSIEPLMNSENKIASEGIGSTQNIGNGFVPKECENIGRISGIYKIINKINGKYYVGKSKDILTPSTGRFARHKKLLKVNKHWNDYLQRAWNKYGEDNFEFKIIEVVSCERCFETEQKYLDVAIREQEQCYNLNFKSEGNEMRKCSYIKNSVAQKMFYERNPLAKYERTIACHTLAAIQKRSDSLKTFWKNNPSLKDKLSKRSKLYFSNPYIRGRFSMKFRNSTIYEFHNTTTNETYIGTQFDFRVKYSLLGGSLSNLIKGKNKSYRSWVVVH